MMKKTLSLILAGILSVGLLAGCQGADTQTSGGGTDSSGQTAAGSVRLNGSTSMQKLTEALCESFNAQSGNITAQGQYTGSGAGVEAVSTGNADIGNASRALKEEEKAKGLAENIVAIDGIAVIVDKNNPVSDITNEQLAAIYTGEISNWKELGGNDAKIVAVGRESGSGTRSAFEEILKVEDQCRYAQELDQTGAVLTTVASTPSAVGYVSLDVLDDTVKALKVNGIEASSDTIRAGEYMMSRPFVMATKGEIGEQSDAVKKFFEYVESEEGQSIIEKVGLITVK